MFTSSCPYTRRDFFLNFFFNEFVMNFVTLSIVRLFPMNRIGSFLSYKHQLLFLLWNFIFLYVPYALSARGGVMSERTWLRLNTSPLFLSTLDEVGACGISNFFLSYN